VEGNGSKVSVVQMRDNRLEWEKGWVGWGLGAIVLEREREKW
jgi:hypothetical protein